MTETGLGPRERLVNSAVAMVGVRGFHGTGVSELLAHSGAARNSIYQHFHGGKAELVEASTLAAGERMSALLGSLYEDGGVEGLVDGLVDWWQRALEHDGFEAGCPVVAAALAGPDLPGVVSAAGTAFTVWCAQLAAALLERGLTADAAESLARFTVGAVEGAVVLCRATKSPRPLDDARTQLRALLELRLRDEG
ncbi:TetR/AcrR family transcriptional regulator [Rhodococcus tukisamuensis]|uniref:DNA-binding transcriptional regulator, AcrR family n=1 Tax=Rhodococcus tukisamuensis TaxID=168276 RepID=A0A1G6TZ97_9NOCA|nr:TetR/AcrR family transcriptional regulator [Rhodococcus tukisamuensis]SDD34391.1 DNA-binding transcriptional regulator, AcrR family [Rhodococcus tukisamuensis]